MKMTLKKFQNWLSLGGLGIICFAASVLHAAAPVDPADVPWEDLFDGKSLKGWIQRNGNAEYKAEDGCIVGATVLNTPNSFLCTKKDYTDFILELEFLVDPDMNSGIQIRSNSSPDYKNGRVHGYQVEIDPSSRAWSGGIYDEGRRGWLYPLKDNPEARKAFRHGEWNHYRIEAIGDRIRTWVNGVPAADLRDDMTSTGFIALQVHSSNTAGQEIRWRNIRIKDLTRAAEPQIIDNATYQAILDYDFGRSRAELAAAEEAFRDADPDQIARAERRLIAALGAEESSYAAKQWVCRMLRRIGSAECVPALAGLLTDPELSHMARFALQYLPPEEAGRALREALGKVEGDLKIGMVGSLGQRGDPEAVDAIAPLLSSNDVALTAAAIKALGRIGGSEAAAALAEAKVHEALETARQNARLMCADSMAVAGDSAAAREIYREMTDASHDLYIRIAAYRGVIRTDQEQAPKTVLELLSLDDPELNQAGARFVGDLPDADQPRGITTMTLASQLPNLTPYSQLLLIRALQERDDKAAAPFITKFVASDDEDLKLAAIEVLGTLGRAAEVPALALASTRPNPVGSAALDSLSRMSASGLEKSLLNEIRSDAPADQRKNLIQVLINRRVTEAVPALLELLGGEDEEIRPAAAEALGKLAGEDALDEMVDHLVQSKSESTRTYLGRALTSMILRLENVSSQPVIAGLDRADPDAQVTLLPVMARLGDGAALQAVRERLHSDNPRVKRAAIRALADWPTTAPLEDLLAEAEAGEGDNTAKIVALRGYIQLLELPANRSAAETVNLLNHAMEVAERPEEKRLILAALPQHACPEAMEMAATAAADPDLAAEAKLAAQKIKSILANRNLSVQASRNSDDADNAIDGNRETRWATGRGMQPGDWFQVDLGAEATIRGLSLDADGSTGDYPRGYRVYVSFDGESWGTPVVTGSGESPVTNIEFPEPVRGRFIRIVQTGEVPDLYWSIHELKVNLE